MTRQVLLAIDTSTEVCSVAACFPIAAHALALPRDAHAAIMVSDDPDGGLRFISLEANTGSVSSTFLLPAVDAVLVAAQVSLDACVALAFGAGPGSFTGLRTATGTAQGLAFGAGLQVVPVNTLMACAEAARLSGTLGERRHVLVATDARMGECYWQAFEWTGQATGWHASGEARVGAPDTVLFPWQDSAPPYLLAGNAAAVFPDALGGINAAQAVDPLARPRAVAVAAIAWRAWRAGNVMAPADALPQYVRNKVASTTREREIERAERAERLEAIAKGTP